MVHPLVRTKYCLAVLIDLDQDSSSFNPSGNPKKNHMSTNMHKERRGRGGSGVGSDGGSRR